MSSKSKVNFALDSVIAVAFLLSALSGIVMLLVPAGYQGGRNPNFGREVLFLGHEAWKGLHTWTSLVMMAGVVLHVLLHRNWIVCMVKRSLSLGEGRSAAQGSCPVSAQTE